LSGEGSEFQCILWAMNRGIRISEIPKEERPREKFASAGAASLSDAELLAILLRTGTHGKSAIHMGKELLNAYGSLIGLSRCSVDELRKCVQGIGLAKATQLATAFELAKRFVKGSVARIKLDDPEAAFRLLFPIMQSLRCESLRVVLLDTRYCMLRIEEISQGTLSESLAHPREVFRPALLYSAYALIIAHNHPSGDPSPSISDHKLTIRLAEVAQLLQIKLMDHVIVGSPDGGRKPYFSFKEAGIL
jgi:DNA repair protein RadC